MSPSRRLGSWRLDRCGHWGWGWFRQLEARDEAVDASLELVECGDQVGRGRLLRHRALNGNLAWLGLGLGLGLGLSMATLPAGANTAGLSKCGLHGRQARKACMRPTGCSWELYGQPRPSAARALRHCRQSGTTPYSTSCLTAIVQLPESDLDVVICRRGGGGYGDEVLTRSTGCG